jgi:hypothetical protein
MRKIEKKMLQAIRDRRNWGMDNTRVSVTPEGCNVYLFGNHIASVEGDVLHINTDTLREWPTRTTQFRLRALETL